MAVIEDKDLSKVILEHEWVPKHEAMNPEEAEKILKQYATTFQNMPRIAKNDPVIKIIDAKSGTMIKIIRNDGSAYYRVVI